MDSRFDLLAAHPVARRTVLGGALAGAAALCLPAADALAADQTEFDRLRLRRVENIVGTGIDPATEPFTTAIRALSDQAAGYLAGFDGSSGRTLLWTDLPIAGPNAGNVCLSYQRLLTIATAWATPGTDQHDSDAVATQLVAGLGFLYDRGYNETMRLSGNWWFWEIGNPKYLTDLCCVLHDRIAPADLAAYLRAIARFAPNPNYRGTGTSLSETGANRTDKALACVLRGVLGTDAGLVALGRDALSDVAGHGRNSIFTYVTSGDGFYADGSFIQHTYLPYVGTYGNVTLSGVAALFHLLGGSSWDITDPNRAVVLDSVQRSFRPFIRHGHMMDTVRGRAVSREREPDYADGFATVSSILLLAQGVPEPYASAYRGLAKGWIQRCTDASYLAQATIPQLARATAVVNDAGTVAIPEPTGHYQFPAQDRAVHRQAGWAFTASISSSRIGRYEWGNRENNLGWYQGDGMTYLYRDDDLDQYSDGYWPTVDPYLLPGTTVTDAPRANGAADGTGVPRATRPWAGGVSVGDRYGAIGMDHRNFDGTLVAKKSWFCFPEGVVAVGAGITGTGGHRVLTVVENRNRHRRTDDRVSVDGRQLADGDTAVADPGWLYAGRLGMIAFPGKGSLLIRLGDRVGDWYTINSGADTAGSTEDLTRRYLTAWFDHGIDPVDAAYGYYLLPEATTPGHAQRALAQLHIVANDEVVQAVEKRSDGVWLGNFFAAGTAGTATTDGPAAVAVRQAQGRTTVVVADPSRTASTVTVTLPEVEAGQVISLDNGLEILGASPLTLRATPTGGRSLTLVMQL